MYHPKPIIVGDGCWIGANSLIMPGVTIGNGVVIAAGSVVTKDCESDCLYGGVPAKKIKEFKWGTPLDKMNITFQMTPVPKERIPASPAL